MKQTYLLSLLALLFVASCQSPEKKSPPFVELVTPLYDSSLAPFYHGVASGDPLPDRVILWTRVTPPDSAKEVLVKWEVAETPEFVSIYKSDTISTRPERDYTVKVDVDALKPGQTYFYRFSALGRTSIIGRTKTAPIATMDSLKFAVVSCSNWEWGFFNAYEKIASRQDIDAVLHLGDYIYEYGRGKYGDTTIRKNLPPHEIVSLADYRTRHSQYRLDKGLRLMSQQHPLIAIWDDHEVANNSYTEGAQNHQPDKEGDYQARKEAAKKAYYEWIPIREGSTHYRGFSYGPLADLIMLDERLEGKTKPVDSLSDPDYTNANRSMLGAEQLNWFTTSLQHSNATWKIVGNQVMFADVELSVVYPNMPRNLDSWDGYPAEKNKVTQFLKENQLKDIVFLTGDTHSSWAIEVATDVKKTYNSKTSAGAFAVEFGTTSVSSANDDEYHGPDTVRMMEKLLLSKNPHIKYLNARDHGYLVLSVYPTHVRAQWYYLTTVRQPETDEYLAATFMVDKGSVRLKK